MGNEVIKFENGYFSLHGSKKEIALVLHNSGQYFRDVDDWAWLCRSCHLRYDDVANKAWATKRRKDRGA